MSEALETTSDQPKQKQLGGVTGKGFLPGQSGNARGRRPVMRDIQKLAREHAPEAIQALVAALHNPRERVPAAMALLDRGYGKPVQMVAGDPERPIAVDFRWADALPTVPAQIEGQAEAPELVFEGEE